jgi:hypothetical protein
MSLIHKYTYLDQGAPLLDYTKGSLNTVLKKCLVDGWTTSSGVTISGAGWQCPYEDVGSGKAVFRSTLSGSRGCYLYIDDNAPISAGDYRFAQVQAYATMSDINTGEEPFSDWNDTSRVWWKVDSTVSGVTARWEVYASDRSFYIVMCSNASYTSRVLNFFGDYKCRDTEFPYNTMLTHGITGDASRASAGYNINSINYDTNGKRCWRYWDYLKGNGNRAIAYFNFGKTNLGYYNAITFPNPATGELLMDKVRLVANGAYMGDMPGLYEPLHRQPYTNMDTFTVDGDVTMSGTVMSVIPLMNAQVFINTSTSWY